MMKKVQRVGKALTLVALPIVLCFTLINVVLISQYKSTDTTLILKEKIVQMGSDTSSSDTNTSKDKLKVRPLVGLVHLLDTIDKKSGDGEHDSEKPKDNVENMDARKYDRVKMQDDGIDEMIHNLKGYSESTFFPKYYWNASLLELTRTFGSAARRFAKTLEGYKLIKL